MSLLVHEFEPEATGYFERGISVSTISLLRSL